MRKRSGEMVSSVIDQNVSKPRRIVPKRTGGLRAAVLLVCLVALHAMPAAARWPYIAGLGSDIDDRLNAIDFDAANNAYVGGAFSGSVSVANMERSSAGRQDLVVAKLNQDGEIQWARTAGGPGIDDVWDLAVDTAGNIYVVGPLCLSPDAAGETCTSTFGELGSVAVPSNGQSAYVAKLNTAGEWQWIRTVTRSGASDDAAFRLKAIAVDGDNVFVSGWFEGSLTSDAGGGFSIDSRADRQDVWIGKLTSGGQWNGVETWPEASPGLAATDFVGASLVVQDGEVVTVAQAVPPVPDPASLVISGGPADDLPGGGSCTVSGVTTNAGGASVTCTGVNLDAHTRIYFGIRNDTIFNGNTMTGTVPNVESIFRWTVGTPSSIRYVGTTTINNILGSSTEAVDNRLSLTAANGDLTVVSTGGVPASNAGGEIEEVFEVASSAFTVQVEVQSSSTTISGLGPSNPHVYDPIHTPISGSSDFSRVDVAFYFSDCGDGVRDLPEACDLGTANGTPTSCCTSTCTLRTTAELCEPSADVRLVVLSANDLTVQAPDGVDLGFNVQRIAGNGVNGLAAIGFLPGGESTTFGADTVDGPALVIARAELDNPVSPLSGVWAASVEGGSAFFGRSVTFDADGVVYVAASYDGTAEFFPETVPDLDPVAPSVPGQEEDLFVAAVDGQTGEWIWSTRGGGVDFDFPTDIAIDRADPNGGLAITGSYTAPAALGEFEFALCESTCTVIENSMQVEKPCNPLNADDLCTLSSCDLPLFCLGGEAPPARTSFAMRLEAAGEWFLPAARWIVGEEIPRPTGLPAIRPTFEITGLSQSEASAHFLWAGFERKLYAIKPTDLPAIVRWQRFADPTLGVEPVAGTIRLPRDPQIHMAGAPADVQLSADDRCPAASDRPFALCERDQDCGAGHDCAPLGMASRWTFGGIRYQTPDSDAIVDANNVFNATAGHAVLAFVNGPTPNPDNHPIALVVVRTLSPVMAASGAPSPCTIGTALADASHRDPNGKNGWVVFENAHYDGFGPEAAYVRDRTRRGPILPVNRETDDPEDDMLVAWYRQDTRGIAWPEVSTRYECEWPEDSDTIVVASELGSDGRCRDVRGACLVDEECASGPCIVQPPLDPANFPNLLIYAQPDPEQPGFNPNEEHALLVSSNAGTGFGAAFALRTDLNVSEGLSDPYVLLKYRDPVSQDWAMRVYEVLLSDAPYTETYQGTAGRQIAPPYPLSLLPACTVSCAPLAADCATPGPSCLANVCVGGSLAGEACADDEACLSACLQQGAEDELCDGPANTALFKDHHAIGTAGTWQGWWARAAGSIKARFHYPLQPGFFADFNLDGVPDRPVGNCEPWLLSGAEQREVSYDIAWPAEVPTLQVGETLLEPKRGLPAISSQAAVEVVFETTSTSSEPQNEAAELVRLIDPLSPRFVDLATLPTDIVTQRRGLTSQIVAGMSGLVKLSPGVSARLSHDANSGRLSFGGVFDETGIGEPLLLLNVMTERERDELLGLSTNVAWRAAVRALYNHTRNPNGVDEDGNGEPDEALLVGFAMDGDRVVRERLLGDKALTAGLAKNTGYVTVAFNNDPALGALPVSLEVVRVDCGPYQGQVQLIPASNIFDEQITLRHSGDFGGDPSSLDFEWYYALKESDCQSMSVPPYPDPVLAPWIPLPGGAGVSDVTLSGPGITSLADVCVLARYRGYSVCDNQTVPSQWAGAPLGPTQFADPKSQLVPGWLVRVTEGLNPFDQRTSDFRNNEVDTLANALVAAGARFEGPIAFNPDADALNDVGLIEIYETVLGRGRDLSIDEGISIDAVNSKLLDVAARVSDLYMLLGNEAFGDALDPTIGFDTSGQFGTAAPSIFAFQDQLDSLLNEELTLLRGRDDSGGAAPVYNRLVWNFTGRDGEVAYQQNYDITNQDGDADIDEFDARILYPQGHGDAWGHYLTAIKGYYALLRHPSFRWVPRSDSVLVAGSEVLVDFTDERRFATAAAARARAGAQVVDLTYRRRWVDDPAGQWQGYKDTDAQRAFGVAEWAQRAGQGAYFDWVVANGILPPQSDAPPGIEKIDRTTVPELGEIVAQSAEIQAQIDLVDQGMNPLGLAKNVVPFDIDPLFLQIGTSVQGLTHFEQISDRANETLANAVRVFDHANGLTQLLRRNQDTAVEFGRNVAAQERDYNNRLIEIFGSPYPEDIGPIGTYRAGYQGPDIWNWDISDPSEVAGEIPGLLADSTSQYSLTVRAPEWDTCAAPLEGTCRFDPSGKLRYNDDGTLVTTETTINVRLSNRGYGRIKDPSWTTRQSPGELQLARSDLLQTRAQFERAVANYSRLIGDIECTVATIRAQNTLAADRLVILNRSKDTRMDLNTSILAAKGVELGLRRTSTIIRDFLGASKEGLPKVVGLATDATSGVRAALLFAGIAGVIGLDIGADAAEGSQLALEQAAEIAAQADAIEVQGLEDDFEIFNLLGTLGERLRQEPVLRIEALTLAESVQQSAARMQQILARGGRVIDELEAFRKRTASKVADSRYSDLAFRIFRNDALQKYRAQLDLASQYVYLAAAAYDYDTNLQGSAEQAGRRFLTDIVRQRSLGQFVDGEPIAGSAGLGDTLARMNANFDVLKGQLGFNNPQTETNRFSLRSELFRILPESDDEWRAKLAQHRVDNLWNFEEFRRFARPPRAEGDGPLPGIIIPIPTSVTFGLNFFGWPLAGGDSAYDPTNFATKVRTVGVWFGNYNAQGLSNTPRVYLIPVGADVLRSPAANDFRIRNWAILDQRIPVPFAIGQSSLDDLTWSPRLDSLSDPIGDIRRFSSFRAFHDSGTFDDSQVTTESRAIGRSVWNTRWMLILTGGTLLSDADNGLDTFIYGQPVAGSGPIVDPDGVARDGQGIDDILLFFQTYALSGN